MLKESIDDASANRIVYTRQRKLLCVNNIADPLLNGGCGDGFLASAPAAFRH